MILIPIFLMLFAGWMLWGWTVGESKNIKWLRQWCAPAFVVTAVLIAGGAGAGISRAVTRQQVLNDVTQLLENIELRIRTGGADLVLSEIEATDHSDDPDRDAFDLLKHLAVMNEHLAPKPEEVAQQADAIERH
ncbi:MAG: hypothetical protein RIK87_16925 [Fuerstiella sp.]